MTGYRPRSRGFTLIELMITVGIIAVLAAIAIPQFNRYGFRARRADGQKLLMAIANAEERYYAQQNKYADLKSIGFSTTTTANSDSGYYQASVTVSAVNGFAAQGYTATATPPQGNVQAKDVCGALSITNAGVKAPLNITSNGSCW
jgi:type IV pilus assembly protein PilE